MRKSLYVTLAVIGLVLLLGLFLQTVNGQESADVWSVQATVNPSAHVGGVTAPLMTVNGELTVTK